LNQTQIDCRKRRGPSQGNSRSIHRRDGEKDKRAQTQDRCYDRDEVRVDLETAEKTPNDVALQKPRNDHSGSEKSDEADQSKERYVTLTDVKQRLLQKRYVHVIVSTCHKGSQPALVQAFGRGNALKFRKGFDCDLKGLLLLGCLLFDVFDDVADGLEFLRIFVWHFDTEFFFKSHHQFDDVQRVGA
jgi:hypothetical protein